MKNVYPLFSIPLYSNNIDISIKDNKFVSSQKNKFMEPLKNGLLSSDNYILNNIQLESLKKDILKEVYFYAYEILNIKKEIKLYINNSWVLFHQSNHSAQSHYHLNSFISGVLYFKVPKNSGNIIFHSPHFNYCIYPRINIPFEKWNMYNTSIWTFPIQEKQLLIFPSNLFHSVENNLSNETRICLSFNVLMKGDLSDTEIGEFKL